MITPRDLAQNLEGTRQLIQGNNATLHHVDPEDIDTIFNVLKYLYEKVEVLSNLEIDSRTKYQKLYRQVHNIPDNAIVEWRE